MPVIGPHPLLGSLPTALVALADLACDLRWSWNHATDPLWEELEPTIWQRTRNPVVVLQNARHDRLEALANDPAFVASVAAANAARQDYLTRPSWFDTTHGGNSTIRIAYFSMEYGITDALPLYSGGLGALAGDHLKTASDLGIPIVAIGLFYRQGYFRQVLDANGWQRELYPVNSATAMPVRPVFEDGGTPLRVTIEFPGRNLLLRIWHVCVGRVDLYLLDSDDPLNSPADRGITSRLYGGDSETRFVQEFVLGIGGWRMLEALGIEVDVCHLNEGHAAFVTMERARRFMASHGVDFLDALWATRAGNVFTTHTPVAAAFDTFPAQLFEKYARQEYAAHATELGIPAAQLLGFGRQDPDDANEPFNMAYFAARSCARLNAVSGLHGEVSRHIFAPLYPRWPLDEVPIGHITNGVHVASWDSHWADELWTQACGKDRWLGRFDCPSAAVARLGDADLWNLRGRERSDLIAYARRRLALQLGQAGHPHAAIAAAQDALDPNILTIGFARRFTEYKRPDLLLRDMRRLARLINDPVRPIQVIVAGKAHPHDDQGKRALQQWAQFVSERQVRNRAVLLEDYDLSLAKELVQGVDVWINTPRRPWEASGTSGMKVLVNGGLNLSEIDGWWAEAFKCEVGWALGNAPGHTSPGGDDVDAEELYRLLEEEIVPCFYERDADGVPRAWVARIRASMAELTPRFSTNRMLAEYVERMYLPAAVDFRLRSAAGGRLARTLREWLHLLNHHWREIHWGRYDVRATEDGWEVDVQVYLGRLSPDALRVQLYAEPRDDLPGECHTLMRGDSLPGAVSGYNYHAVVHTSRNAADFTPRVIPAQATVAVPGEARFIRWYPD
jgi:glycogen phosphorylase